jgi:hypothetical protein
MIGHCTYHKVLPRVAAAFPSARLPVTEQGTGMPGQQGGEHRGTEAVEPQQAR